VLELGCGGENPSTRELASRYDYVGVDISSGQLERARRAFPGARFMLGDASAVELEAASFDGIVSLFMLGHVPRAEQGPLLTRIAGWLRPGGWLLATLGTADAADMVEDDWLGAPMFFSGYDGETNERLVREAGFAVVMARAETDEEFGQPATFLWIVARNAVELTKEA
jgi:SAM-dependent methyltransferase